MPSTQTDRLAGLSTSVALKAPCHAVATSNVTLAGLQTIDGVTLDGETWYRVLCIGQTDSTENGIYDASTGSWTRSKDFDGRRDVVAGTLISARGDGASGRLYEVISDDPIVIGTSEIEIVQRYGANATYDLTETENDAGVTPSDNSKPDNESVIGGNVNRFSSLSNTIPYSTRFVPNGTYALGSSVVEGLFGDGSVTGNGHRLYVPRAPKELNPVKRLIEKLSRLRQNYQNITLIGDSISDGYYVSANANHWFSMLRENINYFQGSGDYELITNFDDPYVNSLTLGGSYSYGSNGPLGHSLILGVGGYIEFTGAFNQVDVFFQRDPAAGTLSFQYNGAAAYKTRSCAGVAADDYHTTQVGGFTAATAASGTHRITASGASVEITGLHRLLSTGYLSGPGQIRFARIARQGYSTAQFTTNVLKSIKRVGASSAPASITSKQALFLVALGTNNMYNSTNKTTVAEYLVQLMKIFASLSEAGSIVFISPFQADRATETGSLFDEYMGAARAACDAFHVPMIELNSFDWQGGSYLQDGLHPNDAGNKKLFEIIVDALSDLPLVEGPGQTGISKDLGNYCGTWSSGALSTGNPNFGFIQGGYWDGTNYVATHTQARVTQHTNGIYYEYLNRGLTPGSSFTPTLAYKIDGTNNNVFQPENGFAQRQRTLTYSASMTGDISLCNQLVVTASNGTAFTVNAPANSTPGQRWTLTIRNASGGALGAATFGAAFKMASWTNPANGFSRSIDFIYDGTNHVECSRTTADIPN
jgi:lysophospholipase L1-like esterase